MNWTSPAELKTQLARHWERGQLPRMLVTGATTMPLRLAIKAPTSVDVTERFEAVREWTARLASVPHIRIEWRDVQHRVQGFQRLAQHVWVDTIDDALTLIGKRREAQHLMQLAELTLACLPALMPWLSKRPLQAIELSNEWARLLAVVQWLIEHPRPGIFLRQVDVPGVHSKFIEANRAVLTELLDLALPASAIQSDQTGVSKFAKRFGFLDKPARIRFRVLDPRIYVLPGCAAGPDLTLDADSFSRLDLPISRIFITENETNFLAFPLAAGAIVIFGAGYGWDSLADAQWLNGRPIHYWGDIDTHGFAILNQLRHQFEHVSSFLMDRQTLSAHQVHWSEEPDQVLHDLSRLTVDERHLYDELRDNRIRRNLRLEQERVGFQWVIDALSRGSTLEYSLSFRPPARPWMNKTPD